MGWLFLSAKRRKFEEAIDTLSWSTLDICLQSNVSDCQTWWLTAAVFSLVIFSLGLGCYGVGPLDSCIKRNLVLWCSYERTQYNCAKIVEKVHLWKWKYIWQNKNFFFRKLCLYLIRKVAYPREESAVTLVCKICINVKDRFCHPTMYKQRMGGTFPSQQCWQIFLVEIATKRTVNVGHCLGYIFQRAILYTLHSVWCVYQFVNDRKGRDFWLL